MDNVKCCCVINPVNLSRTQLFDVCVVVVIFSRAQNFDACDFAAYRFSLMRYSRAQNFDACVYARYRFSVPASFTHIIPGISMQTFWIFQLHQPRTKHSKSSYFGINQLAGLQISAVQLRTNKALSKCQQYYGEPDGHLFSIIFFSFLAAWWKHL